MGYALTVGRLGERKVSEAEYRAAMKKAGFRAKGPLTEKARSFRCTTSDPPISGRMT